MNRRRPRPALALILGGLLSSACSPFRPPPGAIVLGTADPLLVLRIDPRGRWVAACQARRDTNGDGKISISTGPHGDVHGDAMEPYLLGGRKDMPLDEFVAADPNGRRVAVIRSGRLIVLDLDRREEIDLTALGADARDDPSPFGGHRAASFDREGKLLYLKKRGDHTTLAVRSFDGPIRVETTASGMQYSFDERTFDPGNGLLLRADLDEEGAWIVASVVAEDENKNGRLDRPVWETTLSGRRCRARATYSTGGREGDAPERRLIYIYADGPKAPITYPDLLRPLGSSILRRPKTGELYLTTKEGVTTELVPASCGAKVLHADPARELVVVACAGAGKVAPVEVHGLKVNKQLPLSVNLEFAPDQAEYTRSSRIVFIGLEHGYAVLDLDKMTVHPPKGDDYPLHAEASYALLRRGGRLIRLDAAANVETDLGVSVEGEVSTSATSGPLAAVSPWLVDVVRGRVVGRFSGKPLAVSEAGALLFAGAPGYRGVGTGPLYWIHPERLVGTPR